MAKSTKKENALDMFGNIPSVKINNEDKIEETKQDKKETIEHETIIPTEIAKKVQYEIKKANPEKGKISAYVEMETLEKFKSLCKKRGLKLSDVLEQLITIYVEG